jgi:hypothetical protein
MSATEVYARVQSRIWRAIAQQQLDVSQVDRKTLEQLVDVATEAALLELDADIEKAYNTAVVQNSDRFANIDAKETTPTENPAPQNQSESTDAGENVLWRGRPFLTLSIEYIITDERVRILEGIFTRSRQEIELVRIQSIDHTQTLGERLTNIGDVTIRSHNANNPLIVLHNVSNPENIHEIIRRAVLKAREKYNLSYREEM